VASKRIAEVVYEGIRDGRVLVGDQQISEILGMGHVLNGDTSQLRLPLVNGMGTSLPSFHCNKPLSCMDQHGYSLQ
jgi:hypothetical protein